MFVYRIERPNGEGPYAFPGFLTTETEEAPRHPMPFDDGMDIGKITEYHYFGFTSLESLTTWFDSKMREILVGHDCKIHAYDCPPKHILHGRNQIAFVRDASEHIAILDILTFCEIID